MDETTAKRFWSKVDIRGLTYCWPWTASKNEYRYGQVKLGGKVRLAHRVAYEAVQGPIPTGLVIRHRCDFASCINPMHMEPGTQADNVADQVARDRNAKGEANGKAKLTEQQVRDIRRLYATGWTQRELGMTYGMDPSTIGCIVRRGRPGWHKGAMPVISPSEERGFAPPAPSDGWLRLWLRCGYGRPCSHGATVCQSDQADHSSQNPDRLVGTLVDALASPPLVEPL